MRREEKFQEKHRMCGTEKGSNLTKFVPKFDKL